MLYNIYIYVYSVASLAGSDSAQFHVNLAKFVEKVKHLGKSLVLILQTSWQIWRKDIGYLGLSWVTRIAKEHGCHNQSLQKLDPQPSSRFTTLVVIRIHLLTRIGIRIWLNFLTKSSEFGSSKDLVEVWFQKIK